jgi:hypothetical protein
LVIHAVGGVGIVFVGERVAVACGLRDGLIAGQKPKAPIVLIPRDRAPAAQLGVGLDFVEVERIGVVIKVHPYVIADLWPCCHRKTLQHKESVGSAQAGDGALARLPSY